MVNFIAIFGTLAFCHAVFLAVFFWRRREGHILSNRLLALLLLALAVRITKSVVGIVIPGTGMFAPVFGVAGMVLIGPFLWLYLKSILEKWVVLPRQQYFHFLLPAFLIAVFPVLPRSMNYYFYQAAIAHMTVYVVGSTVLLVRRLPFAVSEKNARQWMRLLTTAVGIILSTYYVQMIIDSSRTYILITAVAALTLYLLSFWGMTRMKVFSKNTQPKSLRDEAQVAALAERIRHMFEQEKTYTDVHLTVNRLAERLDAPPYLVSKAVNEVFHKSFPELLHDYRVAEAARRLLHPDFHHLSIEGIAAESGFQSVSTFYTAFKKVKGVTPTEWKRQHFS